MAFRLKTDVLLVGAEWRPRALVRAQLIEEGWDVEALETWREAERLLRRRARKPRLVVFDLTGELHPADALAGMAKLIPADRVVILTSAGALPVADIRAQGFTHVLARPFAVKDVVNRVAALLGQHE